MIGEKIINKFIEPYVDRAIRQQYKTQKKQNVKVGETSLSELANEWERDWNEYAENPDPILNKKSWETYKEVARDGQVHICETIKKVARLSTNWYIEPASDDNIDKKIAKFVEYTLKEMKGTFEQKLKGMYNAFDYGFSVTEKTYGYIDSGEWKGHIGLKYLKTRDPEYLNFDLDKYGNIKNVIQEINLKKNILKQDDVIIYSHNSDYENPYGTADVMFAYKPYLCKKWTRRFWNIAMERFGMGIMIARHEVGDTKQQKYLEDIMQNLQARTGITIPKSVEMEILTSATSGSDIYRSGLDRHDKAIARAIGVPDLLGFSEFAKGSYALGKKHFDAFIWILKEIGRYTVEAIVKEQIIKPLVRMNFNNVTLFPSFEFEPLVKEDVFNIVKTFASAVRLGALIPTTEDGKHTRKLLGYPEIEQEQTTTPTEKKRKKQPKEEEKIKKEYSFKNDVKAYKIFDYKQVEKDWDNIEKQTITEMQDVMKKVKVDLFNTIEKKKLLIPEIADVKDVEKLQVKYIGELRDALRRGLVLGYLTSKNESLKELKKLGAELPGKFAQKDIADLTPEEAFNFFKGKIPIKKKELEYYIRKAFTLAGAERGQILKDTKIILYKSFTGKPPREIKKELDKLFKKYIRTGELKQVTKGNYKLYSGYHIENIVRTNIAEAVSEGRRAMMEDPLISDFVVAYTVSIVLDENTSDYCQSLEGLVWNKNEFEFPPYHYQCRTVALPVTEGEKYKTTEWKKNEKGF